MTRIVCAGEGMVELSRLPGGTSAWQLGFGGDTINTAIHLARHGHHVRYLTALGDDPFSAELRSSWTSEGIDPQLLLTVPEAAPGLYAILTDLAGERTFRYWRSDSAARRMFALPESADAVRHVERADVLAFSLISLAILPQEGRDALIRLAAHMRAAGKVVAFDGNYRPRLWRDAAEAREWRDRAIACCTIGLPSADDEQAMGGPETAEQVATRWLAGGACEVAVKLGAAGCLLSKGGRIAPPQRLTPRDTSGAGDAFNAGYLHARLAGADASRAARAGNLLAGWVVMRSGAIPPRDADAPYDDRA